MRGPHLDPVEEDDVKIKMNRSCAGPAGTFQHGREYDVDKQLGNAWVESGVAEAIDEPGKKKPAKKKPAS
jgi:hypothetical protein